MQTFPQDLWSLLFLVQEQLAQFETSAQFGDFLNVIMKGENIPEISIDIWRMEVFRFMKRLLKYMSIESMIKCLTISKKTLLMDLSETSHIHSQPQPQLQHQHQHQHQHQSQHQNSHSHSHSHSNSNSHSHSHLHHHLPQLHRNSLDNRHENSASNSSNLHSNYENTNIFEEIPDVLMCQIFQYLPMIDREFSGQVCRRFFCWIRSPMSFQMPLSLDLGSFEDVPNAYRQELIQYSRTPYLELSSRYCKSIPISEILKLDEYFPKVEHLFLDLASDCYEHLPKFRQVGHITVTAPKHLRLFGSYFLKWSENQNGYSGQEKLNTLECCEFQPKGIRQIQDFYRALLQLHTHISSIHTIMFRNSIIVPLVNEDVIAGLKDVNDQMQLTREDDTIATLNHIKSFLWTCSAELFSYNDHNSNVVLSFFTKGGSLGLIHEYLERLAIQTPSNMEWSTLDPVVMESFPKLCHLRELIVDHGILNLLLDSLVDSNTGKVFSNQLETVRICFKQAEPKTDDRLFEILFGRKLTQIHLYFEFESPEEMERIIKWLNWEKRFSQTFEPNIPKYLFLNFTKITAMGDRSKPSRNNWLTNLFSFFRREMKLENNKYNNGYEYIVIDISFEQLRFVENHCLKDYLQTSSPQHYKDDRFVLFKNSKYKTLYDGREDRINEIFETYDSFLQAYFCSLYSYENGYDHNSWLDMYAHNNRDNM